MASIALNQANVKHTEASWAYRPSEINGLPYLKRTSRYTIASVTFYYSPTTTPIYNPNVLGDPVIEVLASC